MPIKVTVNIINLIVQRHGICERAVTHECHTACHNSVQRDNMLLKMLHVHTERTKRYYSPQVRLACEHDETRFVDIRKLLVERGSQFLSYAAKVFRGLLF